MMKRTGHTMRRIAWYVTAHPGCSILQIAKAVWPGRSHIAVYGAAHRAIRAGLVFAIQGGRGYHLYPVAL